jgi:transglutaminase-like putative cysteine protease
MIRLLYWLILRLGLRTTTTLLLLLGALGSVALGLADTVQGLDAGLMLPIAALGVVAGWLLARSPFPGWPASLVALGLGAEFTVLRVGRLGSLVVGWLYALANFIWGVWRWRLDGPPDAGTLWQATSELISSLFVILARACQWLLAVARAEAAFDVVAVALAWGIALWTVAGWSGWWLRRHERVVHALAPAGVLLAATQYFLWGNPLYSLALVAAALLLMVLIGQYARERRWDDAAIDFPVDVGHEVILAGCSLSLFLVMVAMLAPPVSVQQMAQLVSRLFAGPASETRPVARSLAKAEPPDSQPVAFLDQDQIRGPGMPRRHLLGSGPELSERVVMIVYPEGYTRPQELVTPASITPPSRYYWRGLTYDRYTRRGWYAGPTQTTGLAAGAPAISTGSMASTTGGRYTWIARHRVRVTGELGVLLYAPGMLLTTDRDYSVAWRALPGDGELPEGDVFGATLRSVVEPGIYRVDSLVPVVGEAQLRSAGTAYPEWIRAHYLALPEDIPPRVLARARDLTATAPTPYDRARAIEAYLRTFPYSLRVSAPPHDRDAVDYFLFDLKQGYCDYYATAMVVLARAAGLPARLVTGYASGTYDAANQRYIVTEADAHSWVEIYFPGYGWAEFEPTAGRTLPNRSIDLPMVATELETLEPLVARRVGLTLSWWLALPGFLLLLGLSAVAWSLGDGWRLRHLQPRMAAGVLYARLYGRVRQLAVPLRAGSTPYELVALFSEYVRQAAGGNHRELLLDPAVQEAGWLADLYVRASFSPYAVTAADLQQARRLWRRLWWRLWLASVWRAGKSPQ